jgi:hypothetical protein
MSEIPFDEARAHRHFAGACFNRAWDYLDLPRRDERQVEEMLHASHASFWHWLQVPECTPTNLSIGFWQLARVYAVAGRAGDARRWAQRCLDVGEASGLEPFYRAYAHEAMARAVLIADTAGGAADAGVADRHLDAARALLPEIDDAEDRDRLAKDLDSLDLRGARESSEVRA